ncbi:MAG: hypothetical protein FWF47_01290 [Clostridia bacterium]|nr:hypothetical protein [Clostridia bacterium]
MKKGRFMVVLALLCAAVALAVLFFIQSGSLREELSKYKEKAESLREEIADLQLRFTHLEELLITQRDEALADASKKDAALNAALDEAGRLAEQSESLSKQVADLETELETAGREITEGKDALSSALSDAAAQYSQLTGQAQSLSLRVTELESQLAAAAVEKEAADALSAALVDSAAQNSLLTEQAQGLSLRVSELESQLESQLAAAATEKETANQLSAVLADSAAQNSLLTEQAQSLTLRVSELESQLDASRAQAALLKAELEDTRSQLVSQGNTDTSDTAAAWYIHPEAGYGFLLPEGWSIAEDTDIAGILKRQMEDRGFLTDDSLPHIETLANLPAVLLHETHQPNPAFRANIIVVCQNLSDEITNDDILSYAGALQEGLINSIPGYTASVPMALVEAGGRRFALSGGEYPLNGLSIRVTEARFVAGTAYYQITMTALADDPIRYDGILHQLIETFITAPYTLW